MQETKRLFAAVKVYPSDGFLHVYNKIKIAFRNERITWVNTANMHLTLKFFGETFTHQIPAIDQCLKAATALTKPFDFEIRDTGMFGSRYQPRVIWFGVEDGGKFQQLFQQVNEGLKTIDIFATRQHFVPHLTIGRIREIKDRRNYQEVLRKYREHSSGRQSIHELVLYESILRREGPVYMPVHIYEFRH